MKSRTPDFPAPLDAEKRKAIRPVICYPVDQLKVAPLELYFRARKNFELVESLEVPAREARTFEIPAGHFFRIVCVDGPQVGDLNLWQAENLQERFYSGKTRALHGTHLSTGDRLWSGFPYLRPLATITADTLDWYSFDEFGAVVHDVIGTRCDPYTSFLLNQTKYHHCCHSNLIRSLALETGLSTAEIEADVHDVLNVFMCTGFLQDTHQYFMKASPVRSGDYLEFFAEVHLLGALSACPGGDCGSEHSSDSSTCYPLRVEHYCPTNDELTKVGWRSPSINGYDRSHGMGN